MFFLFNNVSTKACKPTLILRNLNLTVCLYQIDTLTFIACRTGYHSQAHGLPSAVGGHFAVREARLYVRSNMGESQLKCSKVSCQ
jgi:hypothetical protein